jgi:hypothetical protein
MNMKNRKMISFITVILLLHGFVFNAIAQKSVELGYKLSPDTKYTYNIGTDLDIVFEANGMTMALDNIMNFETIATIESVSDDSIHIGTEIKRIASTQKMFGMEVKYDSDDPSTAQNPMAAQIAAAFGGIIGKSYLVVMDTKGNIIRTDMKQLTDNNDFADNLNSGTQYALYPPQRVKVGDTWEQDINPIETSDMKVHAKYTLLKISGKTATLAVEGTVSANTISDQNITMNGTQKGEMTVDTKTGWLIKSVIDQELEMDIDQGVQKIPASVSGTTTITSSEL